MQAENEKLEVAKAKCVSEISVILRRCTRDHKRWTDSSFSPQEAVWYAPSDPHDELEATGMKNPDTWLRIGEFIPRPTLFPEAPAIIDPRALMQGDIGDHAFLEATALLAACCPDALRALFFRPDAVSSGLIAVAFWINAQWRIVLIDDSIPVKTGHPRIGTVCCYAENRKRRAIWLPFLEKAYAKVHRYYEHIHGGDSRLALSDLSGGATIDIDLSNSLDTGITRLHAYRGLIGEQQAVLHLAFASGGVAGAAVIGEGLEKTEFNISGTYDEQGYIKFNATPIVDKTRLETQDLSTWQFVCISNDVKDLRGDAWPTDNPDCSVKWNARWLKPGTSGGITSTLNTPASPSRVPMSPIDLTPSPTSSTHAFESIWNIAQNLLALKRHVFTVILDDSSQFEGTGLVAGRKYVVSGVFLLKNGTQVVKLRDLFGTTASDWNGDYCEQSPLWDAENLQIWLENYDEGVFFMTWSDFHKYFSKMEMCIIPPQKWIVQSVQGPWKDIKGPERWLQNSRFRLVLREQGIATVVLTLSQPNTKIYEGFDHYLIGIGFCVLMEIPSNRKQQDAKNSSTTVVIAHVPAQKVRDVSTALSIYRIDMPEAHFPGVFYVVPFADTDGVDLPLFLTASSDSKIALEFLKGRSSTLLPMPSKNEPFVDEYEKWYWDVRDKWEGVGIALPRINCGTNNKIYDGLEASLDAPRAQATPPTPVERLQTPGLGHPLREVGGGRPSTTVLNEEQAVDKMQLRRYSLPVPSSRPRSSATRNKSQDDTSSTSMAKAVFKGRQNAEGSTSPDFIDDLGVLNDGEPEHTHPSSEQGTRAQLQQQQQQQQTEVPQSVKPKHPVSPLALDQIGNQPLKARARLPTLHGQKLSNSSSNTPTGKSPSGDSKNKLPRISSSDLVNPPLPSVGWTAEQMQAQQSQLPQTQQQQVRSPSSPSSSSSGLTVIEPARPRAGSSSKSVKRRSIGGASSKISQESFGNNTLPGAPLASISDPLSGEPGREDKSKVCRVM